MKYCTNCGAELANEQFCPNCGTKTNIDSEIQKPKQFCTNCGAELGSEQFCTNCGAKSDFSPAAPVSTGSGKKSIKGIIAVIAAAVIVISVVAFASGGRSYKKVVDEYVKASQDLDASRLINLLSDEMIDYAMDEWGFSSKKEFERRMQQTLQSSLNSMTSGLRKSTGKDLDFDDIKISYKITDVEDVRGSGLKRIRELCEEWDVEPKEAKNVTIDLSVEYDGEEGSQSIDVPVIKIGRSWYLNIF